MWLLRDAQREGDGKSEATIGRSIIYEMPGGYVEAAARERTHCDN